MSGGRGAMYEQSTPLIRSSASSNVFLSIMRKPQQPQAPLSAHYVRHFPRLGRGKLIYRNPKASPVADLSKKQVRKDAADWATGRMGKRPKNTSVSEV